MKLAILALDLYVNPCLIAIDDTAWLKELTLDVFETAFQFFSTPSKLIEDSLGRHAHLFIKHSAHLTPARYGILETVDYQVG